MGNELNKCVSFLGFKFCDKIQSLKYKRMVRKHGGFALKKVYYIK